MEQIIESPTVQPPQTRPTVTLGLDAAKRWRGIYRDERIHAAVVGFPGCGKSRFLLSLAIQDVKEGYGVLLMDPHGDLAKLFLSHIPKERWKDVVYIDPTTARKYGKVVKINFLEVKDAKDRDVVARCFMESLEKIYTKHWGPRLDMILMNAIYALLDAGNTNLSNLYSVVADEQFRETLLQRVGDEKIRSFWENEYKRMPKDASSSVLTKIYRIVQERIVAPMFDCVKSTIDFREAMDSGKIIVVNLSEGEITSDVANFLGSLILSRIYLAGMSREDTPEEKRKPFYVYVDEAYRFVSLSIRDILQSLRKYKVFMTLSSQYLGQYPKEIANSIPHLCDTIICFTVGEETARALEEFFRPSLTYTDIVQLPRYTMAVSTVVGGVRECQILRSVDLGQGPVNIEELIKFSLERYGEDVDYARYGGVPSTWGLPHPTEVGLATPLEWILLVKLYRLLEEELGRGMVSIGSVPAIEQEELIQLLKDEFGVSEAEVLKSLNLLSYHGYVAMRTRVYDCNAIAIPKEPKTLLTPVPCSDCGEPTTRPFRLRNGTYMCKICLGKAIARGEKTVYDVAEPPIDPRDVRPDNVIRIRKTATFYSLTPMARAKFFDRAPRAARGGGPEHAAGIGAIVWGFLKHYFYFEVDVGEEPVRRAQDGSEEYVVKRLPDIIFWPVARTKEGKLNPRLWDTGHAFVVEVEINPVKSKKRVQSNLEKCRKWGKPVIFATTRPEWANQLVELLHNDFQQEVVLDNTGFFGGAYNPKAVSVLFVDPETRTRCFLAPQTPLPVRGETSVETERAPRQEEGASAGSAATEQYAPEKIDHESLEQLIGALSRDGWKFHAGEQDTIYAEKGNLRVKVGSLTSLKPLFQKLNVVLAEGIANDAKPTPLAKVEERVAGHKEPEPGEEDESREEAIAKPEGRKPARWKAEPPAEDGAVEKMKKYAELQYNFRVRKRGDRLYLECYKWSEEKKKVDYKQIGPLTEGLKKKIKELGIEVKGLD
ncbi:MAG: type IV secretion system DNA-binding domain-containing protein [Nitrososphaerota archaeon]